MPLLDHFHPPLYPQHRWDVSLQLGDPVGGRSE